MNSDLLRRLRQLDDYQVLRFLQHFGHELVAGMKVSGDEVRAGVPAEIRGTPGFKTIADLPPNRKSRALKHREAVACARAILELYAQDAALAPALEKALDEYRDDALVADVILAAGFAVSMVIIAATTSFEAVFKNITVKKGEASADLVGKAVGLVAGVVGSGSPADG